MKPITYTESKAYVWSTLGAFFALASIKAFLFRFSNPDPFYATVAFIAASFIVVLFLFPPKLVLDEQGIRGSSFGYVWVRFPWTAVSGIELFRTPVVQTVGSSPTGGRRAIGFRLTHAGPDVRPKSGSYGYDATIVSMWDISLDDVAQQCLAFWHEQGGKGELVNRLPSYKSNQLMLSS